MICYASRKTNETGQIEGSIIDLARRQTDSLRHNALAKVKRGDNAVLVAIRTAEANTVNVNRRIEIHVGTVKGGADEVNRNLMYIGHTCQAVIRIQANRGGTVIDLGQGGKRIAQCKANNTAQVGYVIALNRTVSVNRSTAGIDSIERHIVDRNNMVANVFSSKE